PHAATTAAAALPRASVPAGALPPAAMPSAALSPAAFSLASLPAMAPSSSSSMPFVTLPTAPAPVLNAADTASASPALSAESDLHQT
ncbi:unnamed protein product, partial [Symbiodinium sp. CCMP2456]